MTNSRTGPENRSERQHAATDGEQFSAFEGDPSDDDLAAIEAEENGFADEPEGVAPDSSELEALRAEAARNFDNYQRAVADLANYRRRKEQEVLRVGDEARRALLKRFLPVLDDFERAVKAADGDEAADNVIEGFKLIERKLWAVLENEGVRPMEAVGEPFDPRLHDAIQVEEGAGNPDTVVEEFARGYFIGDEVLRPAVVKVGAGRGES